MSSNPRTRLNVQAPYSILHPRFRQIVKSDFSLQPRLQALEVEEASAPFVRVFSKGGGSLPERRCRLAEKDIIFKYKPCNRDGCRDAASERLLPESDFETVDSPDAWDATS